MRTITNKVQLIGNLGSAPDMKEVKTGNKVARFPVATTEYYKGRSGPVKITHWHSVIAWGRLAETAASYLEKGSRIAVEGKLQTRTWESPEGQKRKITEIVANDLIILGRSSA